MHILLATALLLSATPDGGTPSAAADLSLIEPLPAGFQVDGRLDEWKEPPTLTLGPENQVAGDSKVSSPEDLSAKVWLAIGPEGLAIAGDVRDDRVLPSTKPAELNSDHVEVWLALPTQPIPPLAYTNQFGAQEVPTPDDCNKDPPHGDPEACRKWWKEQSARRRKLAQSLLAQYALSAAGAVRFGQDVALGPVRFETVPGGYHFEALVPSTAFPRTVEAPLAHLRVLVDIVDNDEGHARQESFLSSAPTRRFGDPATFHAVTLTKPLSYAAWPELFERALAEASQQGDDDGWPAISYQPGPRVSAFQVWFNRRMAYQYSPELPSPDVVEVDLSKEQSLAKLGEVELISVSAGVSSVGGTNRWLVSRRGSTILDVKTGFGGSVRAARRGDAVYLLSVYEGSYQEDGHGNCGACPVVGLSLYRMGPDGKFSEPLFSDDAGGPPNGELDPKWKASADLSRIELYGDYEVKGKTLHFFSRHTYNPKTGAYDHATQGSSTGEPE